jgi:hypothetical protein
VGADGGGRRAQGREARRLADYAERVARRRRRWSALAVALAAVAGMAVAAELVYDAARLGAVRWLVVAAVAAAVAAVGAAFAAALARLDGTSRPSRDARRDAGARPDAAQAAVASERPSRRARHLRRRLGLSAPPTGAPAAGGRAASAAGGDGDGRSRRRRVSNRGGRRPPVRDG